MELDVGDRKLDWPEGHAAFWGPKRKGIKRRWEVAGS